MSRPHPPSAPPNRCPYIDMIRCGHAAGANRVYTSFIMVLCYVADDKFIFVGITCNFSKEEVVFITSLPFHGKTIDLKSKKTSNFLILNKHFSESKAFAQKIPESKLIELFQSEEEDIQDFVRIFILHMCFKILLSNNGYACLSNVVKYVEDLEAM
ncbi:hypothetical protein QJS10_CPA07g00772 [Acorus calamus]|uniref:Uncharacterized protein n=1 Tax=Acorus calamus TaxID=4465 RepID=A0AAV9EF61_ACOCL|nr:hypothetical protein QJS10_CPA07g00772 [Acorus calamus]